MLQGTIRQCAAEFWGTMILIAFGCGVNTAVTFGDGKFGDFLSVNFGWAVAVVLGVYASAGISGAHLNPAVTIALAAFRDFSWSKVVPYILAQVAGAFVGAALVLGTNWETFHKVDPAREDIKTTGVFCTYPAEHVSNFPGAFVDQVVGTALLVAMIFAIGDPRNTNPPSWFGPILVGITVFAIGLAYGINAGYAINPARDFGPRLLSFVAGWRDVFTASQGYWWVPIAGPVVGGLAGALGYDLFVGGHHPPEETKLSS
jgi:glycerol uptake facilitator protein